MRFGAVRVVVRRDLASVLGTWLLAPVLTLPDEAEALRGGRGAVWRLALPDGLRVVLRCNRRGGWLARVVRETYLGPWHRPLRELEVTAEARRRGVPAAEILAVRVEGGLVYRGAVVTAEVPDAATLVDALRASPDAGTRRALVEGAARTVAGMHQAGLLHTDLNLTNLLARRVATGGIEMAVLDLDRARLYTPPLARRARRRTLRRLNRSWHKLDPSGALATADDVAAFRATYASQLGAPCVC
ncbi:MAG TPA: lipopolysaccharide kinase InaA family protein [Candidatus Binatia bacterium]|jgi:hypothetical protein|nr:lipopolysaccharide kinase InaA family protein [Candidatus Binatia bacterium]